MVVFSFFFIAFAVNTCECVYVHVFVNACGNILVHVFVHMNEYMHL